MRKKFSTVKTFSLTGSESLIPLLTLAIDRAAEHGVDEIILGMAHRGRLNVLANVMGKSPREIFREVEDSDPELYFGSGDVKYHLGHSSDFVTESGKKVHLSLCFNPSHLEFVDPVVLGRARAKQDRVGDTTHAHKLGLLIHGDAAFAGEGIIQETLNLSQLDAYTTGGTLHVVINNQIGFTTPPSQGRSTTYATDVAKMLQIPIFHVNGEDPEAVAQVVRLAMDFRDTFLRDVVIDMYGYRRHGHNESDEPAFTQPLMYAAIRRAEERARRLLGALAQARRHDRVGGGSHRVERREHLEAELGEARRKDYIKTQDWLGGYWKGYMGGPEANVPEVDTGHRAGPRWGFDPAPERACRRTSTRTSRSSACCRSAPRWATASNRSTGGTAELLAFASLVTEGARVRFTGQDSPRGTFTQRHAGAARRAGRPHVHAALPSVARSGADRDLQLRAQRSRRDGLRVRLQPGLAGWARDLGGAVR